MKQINIRQLRKNISSLLDEMPFLIVKRNRVIAKVIPFKEESTSLLEAKDKEHVNIHPKPKESVNTPPKPVVCVHGIGLGYVCSKCGKDRQIAPEPIQTESVHKPSPDTPEPIISEEKRKELDSIEVKKNIPQDEGNFFFCDFCRTIAVGQYKTKVFDNSAGEETDVVKKLCANHLRKAKNEGAGIELIKEYSQE